MWNMYQSRYWDKDGGEGGHKLCVWWSIQWLPCTIFFEGSLSHSAQEVWYLRTSLVSLSQQVVVQCKSLRFWCCQALFQRVFQNSHTVAGDSTGVKILALHETDPSSIPDTAYSPHAREGLTRKAMSILWILPGVAKIHPNFKCCGSYFVILKYNIEIIKKLFC